MMPGRDILRLPASAACWTWNVAWLSEVTAARPCQHPDRCKCKPVTCPQC